MAKFREATPYEGDILLVRMATGEETPIALHRYTGVTQKDGSVLVRTETNDDDDDGLPDAEWITDTYTCKDAAQFQKWAGGKCRVGIKGVIVTVTLDGKEIR